MDQAAAVLRLKGELRTIASSITTTASPETVIVALLGRVAFTERELARAKQLHLERRSDGHRLEFWTVQDT